MPSIRSSRRSSPFVFSKFNRYYVLAFFGLAFVGPFIDQSLGRDFLSDSGVTFGIGFPLAMVYFLWSAIDIVVWLRKMPNEFFRFAKSESKKPLSNFLSEKSNATWFFSLYAIFAFLLGILFFVKTVNALTVWFR